ncbi:unnamed protein product [Victoria cruziana]
MWSGPISKELTDCCLLESIDLCENSFIRLNSHGVGLAPKPSKPAATAKQLGWHHPSRNQQQFFIGCHGFVHEHSNRKHPSKFRESANLEEILFSSNQISGSLTSGLVNFTAPTHIEVDNKQFTGVKSWTCTRAKVLASPSSKRA